MDSFWRSSYEEYPFWLTEESEIEETIRTHTSGEIPKVGFCAAELSLDVAKAVAEWLTAVRVEDLTIQTTLTSGNTIVADDEWVATILRSPGMSSVKTLQLDDVTVFGPDGRALGARAPALTRFHFFPADVDGGGYFATADDVHGFTRDPGLVRLHTLELEQPLQTSGYELVGGLTWPIRDLRLNATVAGLRELVHAPLLSGVERLDLGLLESESPESLAVGVRAPALRAVRLRGIDEYYFVDSPDAQVSWAGEVLRGLSPCFAALEELDLASLAVDEEVARVLALTEFPRLRRLRLPAGDSTVVAAIESAPWRAQLEGAPW